MGWTSYHASNYKNGTVDRVAEVMDYFNKDERYKVLKASLVGSVVYAAIETFDKDNNKEVFAAIFLTRTDMKEHFNFAYKDMDETVGPYYYDCPQSILKLLTPTESEYANKWREACWANIERKKAEKKDPNNLNNLPLGSVIEMKYWEEDIPTLKLEKIKPYGYKRAIWYSKETGYRYKPETIKRQGYEVLSELASV